VVTAAQLAASLRARGERAVLELDDPPPPDEELRRRALARSLDRIAIAGADGIRWLDEKATLG
jgi:hypothetical protein